MFFFPKKKIELFINKNKKLQVYALSIQFNCMKNGSYSPQDTNLRTSIKKKEALQLSEEQSTKTS